ncbi:MAG: ABC transporter ATP-binding protein [Oligoflexus sp.]
MAGEASLELKNLTKIFNHDLLKKAVAAVDDLTCHFPAGKCTGLMGHNGAGKTTSIRMIFGLIRPDKGQILFRNKPLHWQDKRWIGYMPEVNKLPMNLNAVEILRHQLRIYKPQHISPKKYQTSIEQKLQEVGLWEHRNKWVGQLSKGMGRRLAWAQATIHNPELLILDEPFSGLDPLGRQLMADLINEMRQKNKTILLCTHELWSVNEVCDHLYILNKGKLVFSSLGDENQQKTGHQLNLSGCSLEDLEQLKKSYQLGNWDWHEESGYSIKLWFQDYANAAAWLSACSQSGMIISSFHKTQGFQEQDLLRYFQGEKSA